MRKAYGLVGSVALAMVVAACSATPDSIDDCPKSGAEWNTAKLYIEHNSTDEDTGVHGLFGGEAWSKLCLWDPSGRAVLVADPLGNLDGLRIADLFFESREPDNADYSIADLMADFPEGDYRVGGVDFEGTARVGTAVFTHAIPAAPVITFPALAAEADEAVDPVVTDGLVIRWEPVTATLSGDSVTITGYQIIVTQDEHDDPAGWSRPVYDVHVGPDARSLSVPLEFFRAETVYELEVLALETSGNQTITVGFFVTE